MASSILCVVVLVCALRFSATQTSCKGRCGIEYYRGYSCQCDYTCLSYGECCRDFESQCTTRSSCKGRCGEPFKRGRLCNCDPDCVKFKQCCEDYTENCDAEEKINGAASETAPVKSNSCDNVNDNKPKDPDLTDESEGNDAGEDYSISPLDVLATYPPDAVTDDIYAQTFPVDEFSEPELSPTPESTSGSEPSAANLLEVTTEAPTVFPQTGDDSLFTLDPTAGDVPAESTDAMDLTGSPEPTTTAADPDSSQPTSPSIPELESTGQAEAELVDDVSPSDEPDVTTFNTPEPENPEVTTIPASLTLDSTDTPEETTLNAEGNSDDATTSPTSLTADLEDPSTSASPAGQELDATSDTPTSTAVPQEVTATGVTEAQTKPQDKPHATKPSPAVVTHKPGTKPQDDQKEYQADDSNDTDLCSGRPVSGVTALRNGTIVVFRGHYFWLLNRDMTPGPARGITEVWGVPSPIDTVFTRCNCQGKTYIFKGSRYWRFDNEVLDSGYPKVIQTGFDGLRGHITAALSVPQYRSRREAVYFFKRGGTVQKYSYQFGTSPTCGRKVVYAVHNRVARQAVSVLEPAISIRTSWKGFPSTITAAVSVPSNREPEGYKYYVFSRSKTYNVRMDSGRPTLPAPKANTSPQTSNFIKCPKKV